MAAPARVDFQFRVRPEEMTPHALGGMDEADAQARWALFMQDIEDHVTGAYVSAVTNVSGSDVEWELVNAFGLNTLHNTHDLTTTDIRILADGDALGGGNDIFIGVGGSWNDVDGIADGQTSGAFPTSWIELYDSGAPDGSGSDLFVHAENDLFLEGGRDTFIYNGGGTNRDVFINNSATGNDTFLDAGRWLFSTVADAWDVDVGVGPGAGDDSIFDFHGGGDFTILVEDGGLLALTSDADVTLNAGGQILLAPTTGVVIDTLLYQPAPDAAPSDPGASHLTAWTDEAGDTLNLVVTYADGVTTKVGQVPVF